MTRRIWIVAIAALVVARLLVVASLGDVFGYGEEFTKGAAAKALIDGLPIEYYKLAYGYHEGGGWAVTHVKALLFLVMGPSVLANKVAAILMCVALLAVVIAFAREHLLGSGEVAHGEVGRDASRVGALTAAVAAAFFVLAPTNFVRFSLLNIGTHFEAQIFSLLVLHFTLRVTRTADPRPRDLVLLGLSGGFGLFFSLTMLPALAVAALWLVVHLRARVFRAEGACAIGGFGLGAAPLWIMLALAGRGAILVGGHETTHGWSAIVGALRSLPAPILRSGDPWIVALATAYVAAIVWSVRAVRGRAHAAAGTMLALYTAAYALSGFALEYDPTARGAWFFLLRLTPFWLIGTLFAAHGVAVMWREGRTKMRVLALVITGIVVTSGVRDLVSSCAAGRPGALVENLGTLARTKGYVFPEYFDKMHEHVGGGRDDSVRVLGAYHEDPRRLLPALTQSVFDRWPATPAEAVAYCRERFGENAPYAWLGLGRVMHPNWVNDVPAAFTRLEELPEDAREPVAEALGRTPLFPYFLPRRLDEALAQDVPARWRDAWLRGCGWRAYHTFPYRPDRLEEFLRLRPAAEQVPLRTGAEAARRADSL